MMWLNLCSPRGALKTRLKFKGKGLFTIEGEIHPQMHQGVSALG